MPTISKKEKIKNTTILALALVIINLILYFPSLWIDSSLGWEKGSTSTYLLIISFLTLIGYYLLNHIREKNFFYEFKNDGIRVEKGIFSQKEYFIPYEEIEEIRLELDLLGEFFGVAKLRIKAGETEVELPGIEDYEEKVRIIEKKLPTKEDGNMSNVLNSISSRLLLIEREIANVLDKEERIEKLTESFVRKIERLEEQHQKIKDDVELTIERLEELEEEGSNLREEVEVIEDNFNKEIDIIKKKLEIIKKFEKLLEKEKNEKKGKEKAKESKSKNTKRKKKS